VWCKQCGYCDVVQIIHVLWCIQRDTPGLIDYTPNMCEFKIGYVDVGIKNGSGYWH